jgi:hypothetical protein
MRRLWLTVAVIFLIASFAAKAQVDVGAGVSSGLQRGGVFAFQAKTIALNGALGDKGSISIPSSITRFQILAVTITNCSVTPIAASVGVFTGAGATGTTIVTSATITGATSTSVILSSTLAGTSGATLFSSTPSIFINTSAANVAALTCDFAIRIQDLT